MRRFIDMHKGARVWVCGTGPSLLFVDESRLKKNDVVIACNSAMLHFKRPDYVMWVDGGFAKGDAAKRMFASLRPDQKCINLNPVVPSPNRYTAEIFNASQEWGDWRVKKTTHFPGNVTHRAVSFAFAFGASKIILAGCDCRGNHPYHPEADIAVQPFGEDLMLWREMKKANPYLPIVSISKRSEICYPLVDVESLYV